MIAAYVGENKTFQELYFNGQIQVELTPMGTIVQKLRSAGMGKFLCKNVKKCIKCIGLLVLKANVLCLQNR